MIIMQMHPERNLFKYHLWAYGLHIFVRGLKSFFFLGKVLQPGAHFFLITGKSVPITGGLISWGEGLKAVVYACARHSGIGKGAMRTKLKKTLLFLMPYFSLSEYLERVIISYIAVFSFLEQWNVCTVYIVYAQYIGCGVNLNWFWGIVPNSQSPPSAVVLKLNVVLYRVKVQYLLTGFDNVYFFSSLKIHCFVL